MKKRIILLACLSTVLAAVFLSACTKKTNVNKGEPYIYCLNSDRTGLIKIDYEITRKDSLKAVEAMLKELKKPAQSIDYTPPIPKGVEINKYKLEGQILSLDFNSEYSNIPPLEEKLVRAAVVESLIKIKGVNALWITIDGEDLCNSDGKPAGFLNDDDFVQNTGSSVSSYQKGTLTLYFANAAGDKLVPQQIDVRYSSNMSREKLIVEKLMKGPPKKNNLRPTVNPNVSLLGVTIKDGICYVNFDDEFLTGQVDVKPEVTIYSIVDSLAEGTNASKVQITINGEKNVTYMDTIDLTRPLKKNMKWVEKAKKE